MYLIVALAAEAAPLVEHYGLRAAPRAGAFSLYEGERMRLVISGIGKVHAAAATAYVHALDGARRNAAWLNVGIAGHAERPVGQLVAASRIVDAASGRSWYPPPLVDACPERAELSTVDAPASEYPGDFVYDMEAAGFYAIDARASTSELVQSLKVISDNRDSPAEALDAGVVERLIAARLADIDAFAAGLGALADEAEALERAPPELEAFTSRWHFSVAQRHRLNRLLQRWAVRAGVSPWCEELERCRDGRSALAVLEARLGALPLHP